MHRVTGTCMNGCAGAWTGGGYACHAVRCRPHVIAALPGLRCLDGRVISDAERRGAAENVEQEAALMAIMLRNACSAHKLVRALAGHKGLRKRSPAC
eukprot:365535-Chlamydomonas_euryale.AAC.90